LENKKKTYKNKTKRKITRNKRICCGVPLMSAKFNVFSQTVCPLTDVPHMVLVKTFVKQMVCSSETKWCKSTPKFFKPLAKYKKLTQRTATICTSKLQLLKTKELKKIVKVWECEGWE
jgi:hypothetical protein